MIGELITGAANIIGGLIGAGSATHEGNRAERIQRETNAMQIELANTAHQREMRDLKAAGINPLVTATGGQGASTPTIQAPTQGATGGAKAGAIMGNAIATLPTQIMQYMTGQQQIELARANADKTEAETDKIKEETKWISPQSQMNILEGTQRVAESTQRTQESKARTATIEMTRIPQINQMLQNIAESSQRTKTEEQRTKEMTEAAAVAQRLWGSRASEAETIAAQTASYYKNFFLAKNKQMIDQGDLEIELLRNKNFQLLISNILDNEYGRYQRWGEIMKNGAAQFGLQIAEMIHKKKLGDVTRNPYQ